MMQFHLGCSNLGHCTRTIVVFTGVSLFPQVALFVMHLVSLLSLLFEFRCQSSLRPASLFFVCLLRAWFFIVCSTVLLVGFSTSSVAFSVGCVLLLLMVPEMVWRGCPFGSVAVLLFVIIVCFVIMGTFSLSMSLFDSLTASRSTPCLFLCRCFLVSR